MQKLKMTEFVQKRGLQSRTFKLYNDKIIVETKTFKKNHKYELKLDRIGHEILYESDSVLPGKILCLILLAVPLILLTLKITGIDTKTNYSMVCFNFLCCYLLALFCYLKPHQDDIIIVGSQNDLNFYRQIPDESEVLKFVNLVISQSKLYTKEKLSKYDSSINEESYFNKLNWLKEKDIISEIEFQKLKDEFNFKRLM